MTDIAELQAPQDTGALIDHILIRYHAEHRADLPRLHALAEKVEAVHAGDPDSPRGLADALARLADELEQHMMKEEMILFPAMRAGGGPGIVYPISVMRADHDDHAEGVAQIRKLTQDFTLPEHACKSWRALYDGTVRFLQDLNDHIDLENEVLFPRFEGRA